MRPPPLERPIKPTPFLKATADSLLAALLSRPTEMHELTHKTLALLVLQPFTPREAYEVLELLANNTPKFVGSPEVIAICRSVHDYVRPPLGDQASIIDPEAIREAEYVISRTLAKTSAQFNQSKGPR